MYDKNIPNNFIGQENTVQIVYLYHIFLLRERIIIQFFTSFRENVSVNMNNILR